MVILHIVGFDYNEDRMAKKSNKAGMTLIELMIAIAILAIVSSASYIVMQTQRTRAYDGVRKSDLHSIKTSVESYYDKAGEYPGELPNCGEPLMLGNQVVIASTSCDPTTKEKYFYQTDHENRQWFRLYTSLGNKQDQSISYVSCQGGCGPECVYNYGVSSPNVGLERCSYVCAPGGGQTGSCERYEDPELSECPVLYEGDPTCDGGCSVPKNRCKNASGKNTPD